MIKDPEARIVEKNDWGTYHLLSLKSPNIASRAFPGQFVMIRISPYPYPLLRRPFSIHSRVGDRIEIFFQSTGEGTEILGQKDREEFLDILGPLGKGFTLTEVQKNDIVFAVGGGRGIAPLLFLAEELQKKSVSIKILYGGRTASDLPLLSKFLSANVEISCSTDDGSYGYKGLVTELLEKELAKTHPASIFACGPDLMMEKISKLAVLKKISSQFSLESNMGCGFGACWGCVKRIKRDGEPMWVKICEEGPVFHGEDIVW